MKATRWAEIHTSDGLHGPIHNSGRIRARPGEKKKGINKATPKRPPPGAAEVDPTVGQCTRGKGSGWI
jgi:hypothetical protein